MKVAIQLLVFGIVFYTVIPISTTVCNIVDNIVGTENTLSIIREDTEDVEEAASANDEADESEGFISSAWGTVKDTATDIGNKIINAVTISTEYLQTLVSHFMDAVAALFLTCLIMPLLILMVYKWLIGTMLKIFFIPS